MVQNGAFAFFADSVGKKHVRRDEGNIGSVFLSEIASHIYSGGGGYLYGFTI